MANWLRQLFCHHDYMTAFEADRMVERCPYCGKTRGRGWAITRKV